MSKAGSRVSQRRWSFLRAALLKKEVNLDEFSDITKRSLADIELLEKEQGASLTLRQNDERKIKVNSLSNLRTKEDDADRTGLVTVWPSEEALAYLCVKRSSIFKGKSVIEIGAGAGVAGLALAAVSEASFVLLTDGNSDTVDRLRENIESNREHFGETQVHAEKLDWSEEGLREWQMESAATGKGAKIGSSFDYIICSDCVYHEKLYSPLSLCIKFLLNLDLKGSLDEEKARVDKDLKQNQKQKPVCWLMCPNRNDGYRKFLKVARDDKLLEAQKKETWQVPEELKESFKKKVHVARDFTQDSYPKLLSLP